MFDYFKIITDQKIITLEIEGKKNNEKLSILALAHMLDQFSVLFLVSYKRVQKNTKLKRKYVIKKKKKSKREIDYNVPVKSSRSIRLDILIQFSIKLIMHNNMVRAFCQY